MGVLFEPFGKVDRRSEHPVIRDGLGVIRGRGFSSKLEMDTAGSE